MAPLDVLTGGHIGQVDKWPIQLELGGDQHILLPPGHNDRRRRDFRRRSIRTEMRKESLTRSDWAEVGEHLP
ncbi:hypothetical protein A5725_07330 [Mycobacterium kubicae]|nr:hypothetical protein A5725_07330 [Mycobacterium kubicae]